MADKHELISKIADRVLNDYPSANLKKFDLVMDLDYTDQEMGLDLEGLLKAKPADFQHDIIGILKNFNRQTKKMGNQFVPRYAKNESKNRRGNTVYNAKSFFEKLEKIPTRYKDLLEGYDVVKDSNKLITFEIAAALRKTAGNYLIGTIVPIYVYRGVADFVKKPVAVRDDSRQVGDILVRTYGSKKENGQDVVGYVNVKTGDSWLASTSKDNLKALVGDKADVLADKPEVKQGDIETSEAKKSKNPFVKKIKKVVKKTKHEAFYKHSGTFEDLSSIKEELTALGLKEGSDFIVKMFGDDVELFLNYDENAIPSQISEILGRYGFVASEAPVAPVEAPAEVPSTDEDEVVEKYARAYKKQILEDRARIQAEKAKQKKIQEKERNKPKKQAKKPKKK